MRLRHLSIAVLAACVLLVPGAAQAGKVKTVQLSGDTYAPGKVTIKKGQKLRWRWEGGFDVHDVNVANGPQKFHSPLQSSGTWVHKFKKPGTYALFCSQHPEMTMVVKVKKH
jgi:plastocyanin